MNLVNSTLLTNNGGRLGFMDYTGDVDTTDVGMGYSSGGGADGVHSNAAALFVVTT